MSDRHGCRRARQSIGRMCAKRNRLLDAARTFSTSLVLFNRLVRACASRSVSLGCACAWCDARACVRAVFARICACALLSAMLRRNRHSTHEQLLMSHVRMCTSKQSRESCRSSVDVGVGSSAHRAQHNRARNRSSDCGDSSTAAQAAFHCICRASSEHCAHTPHTPHQAQCATSLRLRDTGTDVAVRVLCRTYPKWSPLLVSQPAST